MNKTTQIYTIDFKGKKYTVLNDKNEPTTFEKPATSNRYKIYLVGNKNDGVYYVGMTKRSMSSRLRGGLKPIHKNGYHGYKWKDLTGKQKLIILSFDDMKNDIEIYKTELYSDVKNAHKSEYDWIKEYIEGIEAEIVHLIRVNIKQWPLYQNEIHFHPSTQKQRDIAQKILGASMQDIKNS